MLDACAYDLLLNQVAKVANLKDVTSSCYFKLLRQIVTSSCYFKLLSYYML